MNIGKTKNNIWFSNEHYLAPKNDGNLIPRAIVLPHPGWKYSKNIIKDTLSNINIKWLSEKKPLYIFLGTNHFRKTNKNLVFKDNFILDFVPNMKFNNKHICESFDGFIEVDNGFMQTEHSFSVPISYFFNWLYNYGITEVDISIYFSTGGWGGLLFPCL